MSGFQGFGCCSALFSALIRRADIQPSTTTPGTLGIKGLHTDFSKGRGKEGAGGGGVGFREVGNTKRNNIQKNRENEKEEEEERMQNAVGAVEGRAEEYRRRRE